MDQMTAGTVLVIATIVVVLTSLPILFLTLRIKPVVLSFHHSGIVVTPCHEGSELIEYRMVSRGQPVGEVRIAAYAGTANDRHDTGIPEMARGEYIMIYTDLNTGVPFWDVAEPRLRDFNLTRDDRLN